MRQERLDLSVLSIEAENLEKLKSSSAMDDLVNKVAEKKARKICTYLNCLANLAPRSIHCK